MPTGIILAYSVPEGAEVFIDGVSASNRYGIARTPSLIPEISAGAHNVTFRLHGYNEETLSIDIPQGGYSTVTAILHRT